MNKVLVVVDMQNDFTVSHPKITIARAFRKENKNVQN